MNQTWKRAILPAALCLLAAPLAGMEFFPLAQVKPGMKGIGRTVFAGEKIEDFQVEILGVLENVAPRQSIIMARLSGGPLEKAGVMAGMSGSPVYIDGKLLGAVALAFPFATEPIAGIRPISEMVEVFQQKAEPPPATLKAALVAFGNGSGAALERWIPAENAPLLPPSPDLLPAQPQLIQIATPVHFAGFTARTLEVFGPALRGLGLLPMQGAGGASVPHSTRMGDPSALQPGSMISVGLIRGDLNVNADGSLTYVDGKKIYAFGHRFLSAGPTELPVMRSSVVALLPNLNSSFKISTAGELVGTIRQDRTAGIYGELGVQPRMIPVELSVRTSRSGSQKYRLELVNDQFLSPFLLQIAVFSSIDATERSLGPSTFQVRGAIRFGGGRPPIQLDNVYAGEANMAGNVALAAALPMAYAMQSGFPDLSVDRVDLEIVSIDQKKQLRLERAWASRREVRPGERLELAAVLREESGGEIVRRIPFDVSYGAPPGVLNITFADGNWMNLSDQRGLAGPGGREATSSAQLVRAINQLRKNSCLYVRVWRSERGFQLQGEPLPAPPASLKSVLAAGSASGGLISNTWTAVLAELEMDGPGTVVSGTGTIRVTVKE
ncbi:MAG: hypothetical protein HY236_06750 [Acidobacteria bacterium]|nr:hypothetical protein [Acidobacteriota bacterium]